MTDILSKLLHKYQSFDVAKRRLSKKDFEQVYRSLNSLNEDLLLVRQLSEEILDFEHPQISIIIPVFNEELEIIPTILTLLLGIRDAKVSAEIIAVDNKSTDRSKDFLLKTGVTVIDCDTPGLRFARNAGVKSCHKNSKYIWLIDADTRLIPPLKKGVGLENFSNPLKVSFHFLEENEKCIAVSTGIVFEHQILLRRVIKKLRILLLSGGTFSCWTGPNQFIRKSALLAVGGIDLDVDGGEDHHRVFQLVRYAKANDLFLAGADRKPELFAPVYTSDRRNAQFYQIIRNLIQQLRKPKYPKDQYGLPIHPKQVRHKDLYRKERGKAAF